MLVEVLFYEIDGRVFGDMHVGGGVILRLGVFSLGRILRA